MPAGSRRLERQPQEEGSGEHTRRATCAEEQNARRAGADPSELGGGARNVPCLAMPRRGVGRCLDVGKERRDAIGQEATQPPYFTCNVEFVTVTPNRPESKGRKGNHSLNAD